MKIELKNIKVALHLSEETTAFTADLYINDVKSAHVRNDGHGGPDLYTSYNPKDWPVIKQAETYCKTLPPEKTTYGSLPMDLELYIGNLLTNHLQAKEDIRYKKKMEKDMEKGILVGNDSEYAIFKFKNSISEVIKSAKDLVKWLNNAIALITPKIKSGERILNTNLPAGVTIPRTVTSSPVS